MTDLKFGGTSPAGTDPAFVESESLMWDMKDGGKRATKPCTHLKYTVEYTDFVAFHNGDTSNAPNPRWQYQPRRGLVSVAHRPSSSLVNAGSYIPVTGNSSDDLGQCVFNAYNQFVNGVRALDASQSIAELGETPALFSLWQRRLSAPANIVNGFLNYSFGWRPVLSDLRAIARELRTFPKTVRKRLKAIGDGEVVRHYRFSLDNTVDDLNVAILDGIEAPYWWGEYHRKLVTQSKSRTVVVTIRANVKPKLGPEGQEILNKLGALGLVPSLATLWAVTRLSFVIDWFYNIGGAIENLQGSLTHDISNVRVCISDSRARNIVHYRETNAGPSVPVLTEKQRSFVRNSTTVPTLPSFNVPRRPMQYLLLGAIALVNTKTGRDILSKGPKLNIDLNLDALRNKLKRGDIILRG